MTKIRRGGYVLITWVSDHAPRDVHVYREGKLVVKWDLENRRAMRGDADGEVRRRVEELEAEGKL